MVEIPIHKFWILREGKVPTNEDCQGNPVHGIQSVSGVGRSSLLGKRKRKDIIRTKFGNID